jgi:hypothetical protein
VAGKALWDSSRGERPKLGCLSDVRPSALTKEEPKKANEAAAVVAIVTSIPKREEPPLEDAIVRLGRLPLG